MIYPTKAYKKTGTEQITIQPKKITGMNVSKTKEKHPLLCITPNFPTDGHHQHSFSGLSSPLYM